MFGWTKKIISKFKFAEKTIMINVRKVDFDVGQLENNTQDSHSNCVKYCNCGKYSSLS